MERRLATVLFADIVGSTELVASADPEVVRRRVTSFFDGAAECIRAHGGTIEKFAGDAVMAAFGIPRAHEDDAERAGRAALQIVESVRRLGLEVRIGVEAGEVVVDEADATFATGGPVNLAARLQAHAEPGEILVGPVARRLAGGSLLTEPLGAVQVRGFGPPVEVWRLVGASEDGRRPASTASPFVGRDDELELLANTWARVVRGGRAHLFTIYGEAGVGKSRLVQEFLAGLESATVLTGRCLPYGESITYWPLAEMVKAAAGISDDDPADEAMAKLRACCGEDAVADLLALASGVLEAVSGERSGQEIAWAAHAWAAELAHAQPLVLVFEDIHWAEEPLLELMEHLADRVREAPLMILCVARPELLDVRPAWGGGRLRATAIELERLTPAASERLLDALAVGTDLTPAARSAVLEKAEGNPLFVEETVRMLSEGSGAPTDRIPDTVQALIAARIDRLEPATRAVLQRASVIGRVFWPGAVARLAPGVPDVAAALGPLLERDFVTAEPRSTIRGERAYRFRHVLIRDVAYGTIGKGERSALHRVFADWLRDRGADELVEIRAYHLDQAAVLEEELDGAVPPELAREAAAALQRAGRRALSREANRPARRLLRRAVELEPTLERRYDAARAAWHLGDLPTTSDEMEHVRALAAEAGDERTEGRALTALADVALLRDADLPRAKELVERALALLGQEESADRFEALVIRSRTGWWLGDLDDHEHDLVQARDLARALERTDLEADATAELAFAALVRLDADRATRLFDAALALAAASGNTLARAWALHGQARLAMLRGEADVALGPSEESRALFQQIGVAWGLGRAHDRLGWLSRMRDDPHGAERHFREAIRVLTGVEDRGTLCESQRGLAELLVALGRLEEAEQLALEARETVGPHDVTSLATTRATLALVRAAQGRAAEADALLGEAFHALEGSQLGLSRLEVLLTAAAVARTLGQAERAAAYETDAAGLVTASVGA